MHLYHDLSSAHNMANTCEMMILVGHYIFNFPSIRDLRVDNNNDEHWNESNYHYRRVPFWTRSYYFA